MPVPEIRWRDQVFTMVANGTYAVTGRPVYVLLTPDGAMYGRVSVNLDTPLNPGEFLVKNWSENEGLLEALVDAGVVIDTGDRIPSGYVDIPVVRLAGVAESGSPGCDSPGFPCGAVQDRRQSETGIPFNGGVSCSG